MRRARDPQRPHPLLRSKEGDLEANYRKPVPRIEVIRIAVKFAIAAAAGVWFKFSIEDGAREGAKLSFAVGATMAGAAIVDLLYLRGHEIELIFLRDKRQQVVARSVLLLAGLAIAFAALARLL